MFCIKISLSGKRTWGKNASPCLRKKCITVSVRKKKCITVVRLPNNEKIDANVPRVRDRIFKKRRRSVLLDVSLRRNNLKRRFGFWTWGSIIMDGASYICIVFASAFWGGLRSICWGHCLGVYMETDCRSESCIRNVWIVNSLDVLYFILGYVVCSKIDTVWI